MSGSVSRAAPGGPPELHRRRERLPVVAKGTPDPSVGAEYLQVATGDINDNVDQYRTQQRQLNSAEAAPR